MATGSNTFEGGSSGAVVTTGTAGGVSGTTPSAVTIAAGDSITFSNAFPAHETMGVRMDFLAAGAGATRISFSTPEAGRLVFSFYYRITTLPTSTEDVAGFRHAGGNMSVLVIGTDGKFAINNTLGTGITAAKSTNTVPINTTIRIDFAIKKGTTTTDGYVGYAYYLGESDTPTFSWESSVQNTNTADIVTSFIGRSTGRTEARTVYYDTVRWNSPVTAGFMTHYVVPPPAVSSDGLNTFDAGVAGSEPTVSNTGGASGTTPNSVVVATSDTMQFSNFAPAHGGMGVEMGFATSGTGATRIIWATPEPGRLVFSFYVQISNDVTAIEDIAGIRNATANLCKFVIESDGKAALTNTLGSVITASKSSVAFPIDTLVRVDISAKKGTTTTDGYMGYSYYLGDSSTPVYTYESSAQNTGTTDIAQVFIGRGIGRTQAHVVYYDTVRWSSPIATGFLAPYVSTTIPPTVTLGTDLPSIAPWETVYLNADASDIDGVITSYSWVQESGPTTLTLTGTGATRTYQAPGLANGGTYVFTVTVTDNNGLTASDTVVHTVLSSSEFFVGPGGVFIPLKISAVVA